MNKRHYEHTLPNIRGSLSNTYSFSSLHSQMNHSFLSSQADTLLGSSMRQAVSDTARRILQNEYDVRGYELPTPDTRRRREKKPEKTGKKTKIGR